jgi:hypothetical protein
MYVMQNYQRYQARLKSDQVKCAEEKNASRLLLLIFIPSFLSSFFQNDPHFDEEVTSTARFLLLYYSLAYFTLQRFDVVPLIPLRLLSNRITTVVCHYLKKVEFISFLASCSLLPISLLQFMTDDRQLVLVKP